MLVRRLLIKQENSISQKRKTFGSLQMIQMADAALAYAADITLTHHTCSFGKVALPQRAHQSDSI